MPERIMPGLGLRAFYDPGQRNWGTSLSEDLRRLSALVQARATSRTTPLPTTGSTGQMLIVPAAASANANALALWDQSPAGAAAWVYLTPQEGWQVWIADEARHVRFAAGAWVEVPRPGIVRIRTLTATSHTLEAVDLGSIIETTGSSAVTVTIPPEATVPFETGSLINLTQVVGTRVSSNTAGQRLSFSLTGPTGPAAVAAIAGVHLKQVAQAGTVGPQAAAGFLRIGGANYDAAPVTVPSLAPRSVYSTWALNPADSSVWTSVTLPAEVGILSA